MKKIIGIFICMLLIASVFSSTVGSVESFGKDSNKSFLGIPVNANDDSSFDMKIKLLMWLSHIPSFTGGVIKNNSIVWEKSYGYSDIYRLKKATTDNIFRIASITKTFTATALLQLYDQGLFDLDDNVSEYLSFDLKNPKYPDVNITFRMLLSHHSSFCCRSIESLFQPLEPATDVSLRNAFLGYLMNWIHLKDVISGYFPEEKYPWIKEVMVPGGSLYHEEYWGDYPPGEGYYYSNTAYILLGHIIEQLTSQSYEDYCRDHIFQPLSMYNTSFYVDDLNADLLSVPYMWLHRIFFPVPDYKYRCRTPSGGLNTNLEDLSHFLIAHMNNGVYNGVRILNESTIEVMHTVQYPHIEPGEYGLGWEIGEVYDGIVEGHGGSTIGFNAGMYFYSPANSSEKFGLIYYWNEEMWGSSVIGFLPQLKDFLLHDRLIFAFLDWTLTF
jgi:CubicO group peptidase (beta-lactamase class C family)